MGSQVITVSPMVEDDVRVLAAMEEHNQARPWTEQLLRDELAAENRVYLVARSSEILGFGGIMIIGDEAHVTNLLVDESARRAGLGRKLLVALVREAVAGGASHLTLEVRTSNESALSLYASIGMVPVGVRPKYYGDEDALIMWAHDIDSEEFMERLT